MAQDHSAPFEGPEKLLEVWFAPSAESVPDASSPSPDGRTGLRKINRRVWEEMLDIVKCQVLSIIEGAEMDAYLLSESSLFVSPHRLILKTCGTTLNLLGLPRILEIASTHAALPSVHRCFYSRKSFMFPERQQGPHRDWRNEVEFLDGIFPNGAAYTVGKVNGDHWLLYMTTPEPRSPSSTEPAEDDTSIPLDYTIEILMSDLSPAARQPFFADSSQCIAGDIPSDKAQALSQALSISDIFPRRLTTLDAFMFSPCGYSSNALIKWDSPASVHAATDTEDDRMSCSQKQNGEGYYTIHVTPEEGWSYASFECNVPLPPSSKTTASSETVIPDLKSLVQRVVKIFQPGRLTLTLFISSKGNENEYGESAVEAAQRAFKAALTAPRSSCASPNGCSEHDAKYRNLIESDRLLYKRTDKINYEFGGYDLAFASFELCH